MPAIIGITCSWDDCNGRYYLSSAYARAITAAGGLSILLPDCISQQQILKLMYLLDGLLLSGGGDVDPVYFGEEPLPDSGEVAPLRDAFEIELTRLALSFGLPILGICRGVQVLNIAAGGDIYQDIYKQVGNCLKHDQDAPRWAPTHNIRIKTGTRLEAILQEKEIRVNSFHHQAIRNVAPGFIVTAYSSDGIIEAIEGMNHPFILGVQFHPEVMWERDQRFLKLFYALVESHLRT